MRFKIKKNFFLQKSKSGWELRWKWSPVESEFTVLYTLTKFETFALLKLYLIF